MEHERCDSSSCPSSRGDLPGVRSTWSWSQFRVECHERKRTELPPRRNSRQGPAMRLAPKLGLLAKGRARVELFGLAVVGL